MDIYKIYRRTRYTLRCAISIYPTVYLPLTHFKRVKSNAAYAVNKNTDIVLEGFPRSGNTFAVFAFKKSQSEILKIAHHLHAPAQLIVASRNNIPAVLIVRKPEDAISSLIQRETIISLRQAFKSWILFYKTLLPFCDSFVVATFEQITHDFGSVVKRVNSRFNTEFEVFIHNDNNVQECFFSIERHSLELSRKGTIRERKIARPSKERSAEKKEILKKLKSARYGKLRESSEKIYKKYETMAKKI